MLLKSVIFLAFLAIGYVEGDEVPEVYWPGNSPSGRFNSHNGESSPETRLLPAECSTGDVETYRLDPLEIYEVRSPNYPLKYPANHECKVKFEGTSAYKLQVYCDVIYLKENDTLTFYDVAQDSNVRVFDGDKLRSEVIEFSAHYGEIRFKTQDFKSGRPSSNGGPPRNKGFSCQVVAVAVWCPCYCGQEYYTQRIIGGSMALPASFPWMVGVDDTTTSPQINCGGALIADRWVLTAAHCISSELKVKLGYWNRNKPNDGVSMEFDAAESIVHPEYNETTLANDIALIRFDPPLDWSEQCVIRPICLPEDNTNNYEDAVASLTGWGYTEGNYLPDYLQRVLLNVLNNTQCQEVFNILENPPSITDYELCATDEGAAFCDGDSGGPLTTLNGNSHEHIGIASWAFDADCAVFPSVFTRVTEYLDWINTNVDSSTYCPRIPSNVG